MTLLRAPKAEEVADLTEALNRPDVLRSILRLPYTGEQLQSKRLLDPGPLAHPVVAEVGGTAVGQGTLLRNAGRQGHSGSVFLFVHDAHWGKGVGTALLEALIDLADNWYGLMRLGLEASPNNTRALALYERFGFVVEGRRRSDVITEGVLEDTLVMGRLRPAPLAPAKA